MMYRRARRRADTRAMEASVFVCRVASSLGHTDVCTQHWPLLNLKSLNSAAVIL